MKSVITAIEDYNELDFDDATDKVMFIPAKRRVAVITIVGKWAMVREKGHRPHVCDVAYLTPNASVSIPGGEPGYDPRECSVSAAIAEAVAAIYFDDNSDYRRALLNVIMHLDAKAYDVTLIDTAKAYRQYCEPNASLTLAGKEG
jgi:hypothetical protein